MSKPDDPMPKPLARPKRKPGDHVWSPIAPEVTDDPDNDEIWQWCLRCGALKLGDYEFLPGRHQRQVLRSSWPHRPCAATTKGAR